MTSKPITLTAIWQHWLSRIGGNWLVATQNMVFHGSLIKKLVVSVDVQGVHIIVPFMALTNTIYRGFQKSTQPQLIQGWGLGDGKQMEPC